MVHPAHADDGTIVMHFWVLNENGSCFSAFRFEESFFDSVAMEESMDVDQDEDEFDAKGAKLQVAALAKLLRGGTCRTGGVPRAAIASGWHDPHSRHAPHTHHTHMHTHTHAHARTRTRTHTRARARLRPPKPLRTTAAAATPTTRWMIRHAGRQGQGRRRSWRWRAHPAAAHRARGAR